MNPQRPIAKVERRALLKASFVGGAAIVMPLALQQAASASVASEGVAVSGADVRKIAEELSGLAISVDDSEKIARSAAPLLASLKYLKLLKTADVRATFDLPALIDDAQHAKP
jgi:hypothetical protein